MSEKLCLQWNDFQENLRGAFGSLKEDKDFTDVTLACEDGQQVEAHKVILAASSPFFQKLLVRNNHPKPLIYMRGVKSEDLLATMDFLYQGEANVLQENLDSFLAFAEELQLKGLMGKREEKVNDLEADEKPLPPTQMLDLKMPSKISNNSSKKRTSMDKKEKPEEGTEVAISSSYSADLDQLEETVKSMMEKSQNKHANGKQLLDQCKVCGKEGMGNAIKDHIEANHLEGIVIPCNLCDKTFRSRASMRYHKKKHTEAKLI